MNKPEESLFIALQPLIGALRTTDSCLKWPTGRLKWTDEPIDKSQVIKHLNGGPRVGAALIQYGSSNTFSALLDLDSHDGVTPMPAMLALAGRLMIIMREYGLAPSSFVSSGGKGIHIWCLWEEPQDAWSVRALMRQVLAKADLKDGARGVAEHEVEIFPKQNGMAEKRIIVDDNGKERVNRGSQVFLPLSGGSVPVDPVTLKLTTKIPENIKWTYSVPVLPAAIEEKRPAKSDQIKKIVGLDSIKSALDAIKNDDDGIDYEDWFKIIAAIHFESGGSTAGIELARKFSRRSTKYDPNQFEYKWDSITNDCDEPATASTIFSIARKFGWEPDDDSRRIDEFNSKHFLVWCGSSLQVGEIQPDEDDRLALRSLRDTRMFYTNLPPIQRGKRSMPFFDYWMENPNRRTYKKLVFEPEGFVPDHHYNMWQGFAVEPRDGDCSLYLGLIRDVICSGSDDLFEWVLAWMAAIVQHPSRNVGTSIALRGGMGAGKGTAVNYFGSLFGQHFIALSSGKELTGNFNSHLKDKLVVFADEAVFAGDHAGKGTLKRLVTEPTINIEGKFKDAYQVRNYIHLVLASNETWVAPVGKDERRFCVIDVSDARKQDLKYFGAIRKQMDNGGREALLHHLLTLDISKINLRQIPGSQALDEQKVQSLSPLESWWLDKLDRGTLYGMRVNATGEWGVTVDTMYNEYLGMTRKRGLTYLDSTSVFATGMKKLVPNLIKRRLMIGNSRQYCWILPSLADCRAVFPGRLGNGNGGDVIDEWEWIEQDFRNEI